VRHAIEESLALGLHGVKGIVADSKADSQRTLGLCLEQQVGLVTLVPRTCAIRQEVEAWGQQQRSLPLLLDKAGRRHQDAARRWYGRSVTRPVEVEYEDGRGALAPIRFVAVYSNQLAQQHAQTYSTAQAKEAQELALYITQVEARRFACEADAEAAIAEYAGPRPGAAWPTPRPLAPPHGALSGTDGVGAQEASTTRAAAPRRRGGTRAGLSVVPPPEGPDATGVDVWLAGTGNHAERRPVW
jgi:hypothetical protein